MQGWSLLNNNHKNYNIQNDYNNVLNNIKNDFLLLDSIKNGPHNYLQNNNLTDRNINKKINFVLNDNY